MKAGSDLMILSAILFLADCVSKRVAEAGRVEVVNPERQND